MRVALKTVECGPQDSEAEPEATAVEEEEEGTAESMRKGKNKRKLPLCIQLTGTMPSQAQGPTPDLEACSQIILMFSLLVSRIKKVLLPPF